MTTIYPKDLGFDKESLNSIENASLLSFCILKNTDLESINADGLEGLKSESVVKILEACSQITGLKKLPMEIF